MKILWRGFFDGYTGYIVSTNMMPIILQKAGFEVRVQSINGKMPKGHKLESIEYDPEKDKEVLTIMQQVPSFNPGLHPPADGYCTLVESHVPSFAWITPLNDAKIIITFSHYCKEVFSKVVDDRTKIKVINLPFPDYIDPKIDGHKFSLPTQPKFIFGSMFDWVARKYPEIMWQAFKEEFPLKDYPDVYFVNKITIPQGFREWRTFFNKYTMHSNLPIGQIPVESDRDPRIVAIMRQFENMSTFYRGIDCYVSSSGGEGWGLPLYEALAAEIPVVAPRHSGNLEFMTDENSYLVDVEDWKPIGYNPVNKIPFMVPDYSKFRVPKIKALRNHMRTVYDIKMMGRSNPRAGKCREDIQKRFSMDKIIDQARRAFQ